MAHLGSAGPDRDSSRLCELLVYGMVEDSCPARAVHGMAWLGRDEEVESAHSAVTQNAKHLTEGRIGGLADARHNA